jgi:hypothetical protein
MSGFWHVWGSESLHGEGPPALAQSENEGTTTSQAYYSDYLGLCARGMLHAEEQIRHGFHSKGCKNIKERL